MTLQTTWWHSEDVESYHSVSFSFQWCFITCLCPILHLHRAESFPQRWHITRHIKTNFRSPNSPASFSRLYNLPVEHTMLHFFFSLKKKKIPVCFTLFPLTFHVLMIFYFHYIPSHCSKMFRFVSLRFPLHYFISFLINSAIIAKRRSRVFQNG